MADIPDKLLALIRASVSRRARLMIDHILEHGSITTEDLEQQYGYRHPPRAARDVREAGIPLETFTVKNAEGKSIAAYRFGDLSQIDRDKLQGRRTFSRTFKAELMTLQAGRCAVCNTAYEARYLQIDHRIPYEVAGDNPAAEPIPSDSMLLCASCNRAKAWSCQHCENGQQTQDPAVCEACYWAHPTNYQHIATQPIRRIALTWTGTDVAQFERWESEARATGLELQEYLKRKLRDDR